MNEAVKEVLSEQIPTLKDPGIGFVTVTGVEVTTDLKQATVWVSVLGSDEKRRRTLSALERARGVLQSRLNAQLRLRRIPTLSFAYDPSVERGVRMTKLIDELAPEADATEGRADSDDA